jgi:hypothetical protein
LEQRAVDNLLALYSTARRQADIDRVDALLDPAAPQATTAALVAQGSQRQVDEGAVTDVQALRATLTKTFRTRTVTGLDIPAETIKVATDRHSVTFLEVESTEDPVTLVQQTRLFHTTLGLTQDEVHGTVTVRIGTVQREGPLVQVTTPGQVQAGALTRVEVRGTGEPFALAGVEVTVPETGAGQAVMAIEGAWQGVFTPPMQPSPQPLRVQLHGAGGETLVLPHPYRLRVRGEGVVARVAGTESTRVFAVTVAPDGTVWAGGDAGATLFQVPSGVSSATQVGRLLANSDGRVEAVVVDQLGRLHVLVLDLATNEVVGHGDIVRDPAYPALFCQTVNIFDATYPFRDSQGQASASTRVLDAGGGDVWLFGSDGGVARVQDSFRGGQCPTPGPMVRYEPVFRRDTSALPTNTIPAFVAEADGTLWFGTALGLTRLQQGHFTPVPFDRSLTVTGNVATMEAFFQAVAQALFAAQPLSTVELRGVSFVEQFGRPVVKEDLIFSAVAVAPSQLWVGTLGGGLRRIDGRGATPQDIRHLTKRDGLPSNLIVALAVAPNGTLWVATDKGVSHLREVGDAVTLTTFAALDGLALPVRDVAVDATGTVWLATDDGLFRIVPQGGTVQGLVVDAFSRPVVGADVTLLGTPFHAVTDATGHFVLANLPGGAQRLQVDGRLAVGGPFPPALRTITVPAEESVTLEPIVLPPSLLGPVPPELRTLIPVSEVEQRGTVGTKLYLTVAVVQAGDTPVPGVPVTFTVTEGQGTLAPGQPVLTDAQGRAEVTLTLGTRAGLQKVKVTAPGLASVPFTVTGVADREHVRLLQVSGNNQVGEQGDLLLPLVVRLEDLFANPVAGVDVKGKAILGVVFVDPPASQATLTASLKQSQTSDQTDPCERTGGNGMVFVDPPASQATLTASLKQSQTSDQTVRCERTGDDGVARFFVQVISPVSQALVQVTAPKVEVPVLFLLQRIDVGLSPFSVVVADLDDDGFLDLVTANASSDNVSVLLGRGDGTFKAAQFFPVGKGKSPRSVAVADLNHDGFLDLMTANASSNDVSVLLGRGNDSHGDVTFAPAQPFPVGNGPFSVAVADLDGDKILDLVTANAGPDDEARDKKPSNVSVLLGRGDGTFKAAQFFPVGAGPRSVAVADLNHDGRLDLVTANAGSNDVSVLLGHGDGTFEPERRFCVGVFPQSVAVADLNGDKIPDLVTANASSNDVSVLLGCGDGTFKAEQRSLVVGIFPDSVAVADLDDDGTLDLVTANLLSADVSVLRGRGDGTFVAEQHVAVGTGPRVAVADLNDDGILDLVTANETSNDVSVLPGRDDGTFVGEPRITVGASPESVAVADLDGDKIPDLVTANKNSYDVSVLRGRGDGTFAAQQRFGVGAGPQSVAVADLNGDGTLDLVTMNEFDNMVSVLLRRGDGTFAAAQRFAVGNVRQNAVEGGPQAVAVADLDGDKIPDLVTVNTGSDDVFVLLGRGDGTFKAAQPFPVGAGPRSVAVADLNHDGRLDLVTANAGSDDVSVLLGRGDGTFAAAQRFDVGVRAAPFSVAVADLDGNGTLDLVTANAFSSSVSVLLGRGDGTFGKLPVSP